MPTDSEATLELSSKEPTDVTIENNYAHFIALMRDPAARSLLAMIRAFLHQFRSIQPEQRAERYSEFMDRLLEDACSVQVLSASYAPGFLHESLQYLVTNQLSDVAMDGIARSEGVREREEQLLHKMLLYSWIEPRHLGYNAGGPPDVIEGFMRVAIEELEHLPKYKTPRDKKTLLLNAARVLCGGLGEDVSADDLLPCLITSIIRARPDRLVSTCRYIQFYNLSGQNDQHEGYLFTNILAAISFIEQLDRKAIKVDDDSEYEENMERSVMLLNDFLVALPRESSHGDGDGVAEGMEQLKVLEAKAKRMISQVKQNTFVNKSLGAFKKFLADAEQALSEPAHYSEQAHSSRSKDEKSSEEEYQLQLAMAISLSELEAEQRKNMAVETD